MWKTGIFHPSTRLRYLKLVQQPSFGINSTQEGDYLGWQDQISVI